MRTGPRSPTWRSEDAFKTGLPNATTVSRDIPSPPPPRAPGIYWRSPKRVELTRQAGKKQKKRLEDAEARAASAHQSPQALHQELESSSSQASDCSLSQDYLASYGTPEPGSRYISPDLLSSGYYPEELSEEDRQAIFPDPYANEVAASSSHLAHWGYPVSSQSMYRASSDPSAYAPVPSTYGHHPSAQMTLPSSTGAGLAIHGQYLPSMSATSPAMTKEEQAAIYVENDLTNPYGMNYAFMASLDMSTPQLDPESNHQVNLSHNPPFFLIISFSCPGTRSPFIAMSYRILENNKKLTVDFLQTPSLADSLELSPAGSPPDSAGFFPGTPLFFSPGSPLI